jgi:signal transduction histidine kinase
VASAAIAVFTLGTLLAPTPLDRRLEGMVSPTGLPDELSTVADAVAIVGLVGCVAALGVAVASLVARWRTGDELQRQQLTWLGLSFTLPLVLLPFAATEAAQPWMFAVVTLPVPVALAVAILQRRLYDVQLAASRTATYLALTAALASLYALVVGGIGALLDERGAAWLPWVATGLVAVCFAPLHQALQQAVNRLTYGHWSQPREVLGAAAQRLADATDVPLLLEGLVTDLTGSLRLSRVEIRSANGALHAAHGPDVAPTGGLTLMAYGEPVGVLRWTSELPLRETDRRLLGDLAHQLGVVVHGALLVDHLRTAQHHLVLAREEERRRLRRDLHDGLGPSLASLTLRVDTLRNRWATLDDPDPELVALRSAIQVSIADVRRIVEDLRPAPLDELGLVGALQEIADSSAADIGVDLLVEPLPPLSAAVEVAVFRVVQEALANAVRHANAATVQVAIRASAGVLHVEVADDGAGAALPRPGGVGLHSMRERAEELGGRLVVSGGPEAGTVVHLQVPITMPAGA